MIKIWLWTLKRDACLQKVPNVVIQLGKFWYFVTYTLY